jgi:hypothetical protein
MRICCALRSRQALALIFFLSLIPRVPAQDSQPLTADQLVRQMEVVEAAAKDERQLFVYRSKERSVRTGGKMWDELVVESSDGRIRRLLAIDGKPLSPPAQTAEDNRLKNLLKHPEEYRREGAALKEDEDRLAKLLQQVPKLYVFRIDGVDGDCTRVTFEPNPQFQEQTFQDRILHAMRGVLFIHKGNHRLCGMDAHLAYTVEFGFGLLGKVNVGSQFSVRREQILPGQWKNVKINVHVDGRILLLKSVAREEDAAHFDFKPVPQDITPAQASAMARAFQP